MILAHNSVEGYYKDIASIIQSEFVRLGLSEVEDMPPGELEIYAILFANKRMQDEQ